MPEHGSEVLQPSLVTVGIYYCVFMAGRSARRLFGFLLERRENWSLLWWLMLQRFGYRQIMYYVLVRRSSPRSAAFRRPGASWSAPAR